jgi:type IX secretion system PorP/SprF family membrane protein
MNRFFLIVLTLMFPVNMFCQMYTLSDQYLNNTLAFNPAFAGSHDALSVSVLYRNQWVGFEDAPLSNILSVHTPLNNGRIGIGLLIDKESYGIYNETGINGNYAYRIELNKGILALGIGFGVTIKHVAWDELNPADEGDILLMDSPETSVLPDFGLGMYYYNNKYFFGFSIPMMLSHELEQNSGKYRIKNDLSEYNYFLEGGYYIGLAPNVKLLPSLLVKYHPGHDPQMDINAQVILKERLWLGAGYRSANTLLGMLQCQLNRQLMIAYSYSFDTGSTGKYNSGSHEVVMNYIFRYSRKVISPRQF